ncbi:glutamate 5-kinase [Schaalia suimastitidis]|uniref:glutamate 5-kinase n=1 Tax=Schaalia suimastitidis TaxID=121163 RepID=UPI000417A8B1|nr:glutamate 5-kinase [Schaalia suimastitidis]
MNTALAKARRIVVKIGSSSLTRQDGGLDLNRIDVVARLAAKWQRSGREIVVVSSGAVAAGLGPLGLERRPRDLANVQAAAAMGQGLLVAHWSSAFQAHHRHVAQVLLTTRDIMRREHYTNARSAIERLLAYKVVPIINENDAVTTREVRFGDNDRLAAHVAQLIAADVLVLLTDVDGLYTAPPSQPGARLVERVTHADDLEGLLVTGAGSKVGSGGMATKVQAASMATAAGIGVVLTSADALADVLAGRRVGTWFEPHAQRPTSRALWIAHAAHSQGEILVDAGAVRALTVGKKSLLAAGVVGVKGHFASGDVVDIVSDCGLVGRGITSYDSDTAAQIAGVPSEELVARGWDNPRPLIHRDDLALLT